MCIHLHNFIITSLSAADYYKFHFHFQKVPIYTISYPSAPKDFQN